MNGDKSRLNCPDRYTFSCQRRPPCPLGRDVQAPISASADVENRWPTCQMSLTPCCWYGFIFQQTASAAAVDLFGHRVVCTAICRTGFRNRGSASVTTTTGCDRLGLYSVEVVHGSSSRCSRLIRYRIVKFELIATVLKHSHAAVVCESINLSGTLRWNCSETVALSRCTREAPPGGIRLGINLKQCISMNAVTLERQLRVYSES